MQDNPNPDLPLGDTFKLAVEDLKAFYNESAAAQPGYASSKDVADWFWGQTSAGNMLLHLLLRIPHFRFGSAGFVTHGTGARP